MVRARVLVISLLVVIEVLVLLSAGVSAPETPDYEGYVVSGTQTLATIAADYGIAVDELARFNQLAVDTVLKPGQVIMVPIVSQMAPQLATTAEPAAAKTPQGEMVTGLVATVKVAKTDILRRPAPGPALFSNAAQGTRLLVTGQSGNYYAVLMSDGSTGWVPISTLALTETRMQIPKPATPVTASLAGRSKFVDTAMEYLGTPYQYGGRLPKTVDCSLLVQTVFARHGVKLPRTAAQQFGVGAAVEVVDLQPGDRLYFYGSGGIGHTGLYMGDGRFIHASSNRGRVAIDELANPSYWRKYAGARR
ncbi:MAG: Gamma-DL-glutamyl hydrolase precursor [bacterium ADurb.Bin429]|nr:MAG: Gamma-DL-glutamyl hydrolase precursor [bacterium ADurb.Bin429]